MRLPINLIDGGGDSDAPIEVPKTTAKAAPAPAPAPVDLVSLAKTAGATGDYSNLNKIIKNPEAYSAFKDARLERIRAERIAKTPLKPSTITPPPPPTPTPSSTTTIVTSSRPPIIESPNPTPSTPSTVSSAPSNISPVTQAPPPPPVKTAAIDTILFNEDAVPIQIMADLIFENIGGQELINIARNDTVNGQQIIYQPIKNLTQIQQQYNPNNIVSLQSTSDKYFQNFSINFDSKVPTEPTGPGGSHVYIDPETGDLIVEAVNLQQDEQIEVEITTGGTIYEAEL